MERPPNEALTHVAISGEKNIGPGVVFIDIQEESARYVKFDDLQPANFKNKLEDMVNEDGDKYFYMVQKDNLNLHVFKTLREAAQKQLTLQHKEIV